MTSISAFAGVFISYRRSSSSWTAQRLYTDLSRELGADQVFVDVDTLQPGSHWPSDVTDALRAASTVLVLIDPEWVDARRLHDPGDVVRKEIELAMSCRRKLIPVLVDGASMPAREALPNSLAQLLSYQSVTLGFPSFDADVDALVRSIKPYVPFSLRSGMHEYHPRYSGFYVQLLDDTVFLTRTPPRGENYWRSASGFGLSWTAPDAQAPVEFRWAPDRSAFQCRWR